MSEPTKSTEPTKNLSLDWKKAEKHLDEVEAEVKKLSIFQSSNPEKGELEGQPKPGMNPAFFYNKITTPLREAMANEAARDQALFLKILATQAEEPLVKKFYTPVSFSVKPSAPVTQGLKAV